MNRKDESNEYESLGWEHPAVCRYERTIPLKIPGYASLYEITNRLLTTQREEESATAHILIIGAGGGQECISLGEAHNDRTLTGVDPSARMLEIARRRVEEAGIHRRVTLIQGTIENLPPDQLYDAATCMLVLHFIRGLSAKQNLLHQLAVRLKPGAPLFLASINGEPGTPAFGLQMRTWVKHMQDNGVSAEETERFIGSFGSNYDPVPSRQVPELLKEAGFDQPTSYFGSYLIDAWVATKREE